MLKKLRRRLIKAFGSSNDLSEFDNRPNGVHLISASIVDSRLPPGYSTTNRSSNKRKDLPGFDEIPAYFSQMSRVDDYPMTNGLHYDGRISGRYAGYSSRPSSVYSLYGSNMQVDRELKAY
jgi:hypothetical protein